MSAALVLFPRRGTPPAAKADGLPSLPRQCLLFAAKLRQLADENPQALRQALPVFERVVDDLLVLNEVRS